MPFIADDSKDWLYANEGPCKKYTGFDTSLFVMLCLSKHLNRSQHALLSHSVCLKERRRDSDSMQHWPSIFTYPD
eukprot:1475188-Pleurochrysis_carterae.AAC.2